MDETDRLEDLEFDANHWSADKLAAILHCGYKYYLGRVLKVKKPPKPAQLIFGSDVHRCLEIIEKEKISEETTAVRLWLDMWTKSSKDIDWDNQLVTRLVYKNRGAKMMEQYMKQLQVHKPFRFEVRFKGSRVLPVQGIIDKMVMLDDDTIGIIDYKTGKYPPDPLVLRRDYQLTFYFLGAQELGYNINHFAIHHLLSGDIYWTWRDWNDVEELKVAVSEMEKRIEQEMYVRNVSPACKFCPHKERCLSL